MGGNNYDGICTILYIKMTDGKSNVTSGGQNFDTVKPLCEKHN